MPKRDSKKREPQFFQLSSFVLYHGRSCLFETILITFEGVFPKNFKALGHDLKIIYILEKKTV